MGMFNYVDMKIFCPACKEIVKNFTTKDGDSALMTLPKTVSLDIVSVFSATCPKCKALIKFQRQPHAEHPLVGFSCDVTAKKGRYRIDGHKIECAHNICPACDGSGRSGGEKRSGAHDIGES